MGADNIAASKAVDGRPSEYTDEVVKKSLYYLADGYKDLGDIVPSVAGLACFLGRPRNRLYEWAKRYDDFQDMLNSIATLQERMLINGGLGGDFNPAISKLMMAKHNYSDKIEQDVTSSDGSMTPKAAISKEDVKEILKGASEKI